MLSPFSLNILKQPFFVHTYLHAIILNNQSRKNSGTASAWAIVNPNKSN